MMQQLGSLLILLTGTAASLAVWMWVVARLRTGQAVLEPVRRRLSPLRGLDVLALACAWIVLQAGCQALADDWMPSGIGPTAEVEATVAEDLKNAHPIARLIVERPGPLTALLCVLAAVVAAPVVEEFLFRGLLQGWLEDTERHVRRRPAQLAVLPAGALPIVLSALLFGFVHYRAPVADADLRQVYVNLVAAISSGFLLLVVAMGLFALRGVRPGRVGFSLAHLGTDLPLGLATFAALLVPTYGLQLLLQLLPWQQQVTDPAPMYVYGLVAGYVWQRTGRLAPVMIAHGSFNALALLRLYLLPLG